MQLFTGIRGYLPYLMPSTIWIPSIREGLRRRVCGSVPLAYRGVFSLGEKNREGLELAFDDVYDRANDVKDRSKVTRLRVYLSGNWAGIHELSHARLVIIEGRVRDTLARRTKSIGDCCNKSGMDNMVHLSPVA